MGKWDKLKQQAQNGSANVRYSDLCHFLELAGFEFKGQVNTSHRKYQHPKCPKELVNVQEGRDGKAKPYQVRQVLDLIETYDLEPVDPDED